MANMESANVSLLPSLSGFQSIRQRSLKTVLLSQIGSISGTEKEYLISRYFELNLVSSDLSLCASSFWWKRLEGLSNLRALGSSRLAPLFVKMKADPNEIVSISAKLALSELQHPLNTINIAEMIPLIRNGRESSLVQIAINLCEVRGFDQVFSFFKSYPDPKIRESLLIALSNVKTGDSSFYFTQFLETAEFESPHLLAVILRSLRDAGDPQGLSTVINYVHHPDQRVQGLAMEYILEFLPEERYAELRILELDPSPFVQRVLKSWQSRRAA